MTDENVSSAQFEGASEKNQLQLIPKLIDAGEPGWAVLKDFLRLRQSKPVTLVTGKAYQSLYLTQVSENLNFLQSTFNGGIVALKSERNVDYQPLQKLLIEQKWQEADKLTRDKLCESASEGARNRKWLYFTEVEKIPQSDLNTINELWLIYSEGKFGFSVQRQLWLSLGKDFTKLWPVIGWKNGNLWTKYPNQFTWDLSAPVGHLPLSNQLRGVKVLDYIFSHPLWSQKPS